MNPILDFDLYSSSNQTCPTDIITYTIKITNKSEYIIENIIIKDLLPAELRFIIGSIKIDYTSDPHSNILSGVTVGCLKPWQTKTLSFSAEVIRLGSKVVSNEALAEFTYKDQHKTCYSTITSSPSKICIKNPSINLIYTANSSTAQLGDIVTYNLVIANDGDLDLENLLLLTDMSKSLQLVDGSFKINNVTINSVELNKGIFLNSLNTNNVLYIEYKAKVISHGVTSKLFTESKLKYSCYLPNETRICKETDTKVLCVDMSISNFKQFSIDHYLRIPCHKPDMECINDLKISLKINKCSVIKTPIASSSGGQVLSGYKLIIHGSITQLIEYVACDATQTLHCANFESTFSSYIILPNDFVGGSKVHVEGIVEDVSYNVINNRTFFENISILLLAKISSCN